MINVCNYGHSSRSGISSGKWSGEGKGPMNHDKA